MRLTKTFILFAEGALWRVTRQRWFGRRLVNGLGESDENVRSVAGIILAKNGVEAMPVLQLALKERTNVPEVLTVLGDVGDASAYVDLARFTTDSDEKIAEAAKAALRVLSLRLGYN